MMTTTLRNTLDLKPMGFYQCMVVALCFLVNMLDGFDVLIMAFTASSVSAEWGLTGSQIGYLLSAGLVGMAGGSLFIAPLADRFGRRPLILVSVTIAGVGMLVSSEAPSPGILGLLRFITGLGIGGILATSFVIAGEYASKRWRGLAISLQATAYALGATVGGLAAAQIIPLSGWRYVFMYGGIVTLLTIPILLLLLPESLDFLLARQPQNALSRINKITRKLALPPSSTLPPLLIVSTPTIRQNLRAILSPALLHSTILIWIAFFLTMFGFYFIMSWTPRLLVSGGLSNQQGISAGVLLNVGGIFGAFLIGMLAAHFRLARVLAVYLFATALLVSLFTSTLQNLNIAFLCVLLIGICVNGCIAGLYGLTPSVYGPTERVTGLGWGIGVGRIGAILSPLVAGALIDSHWTPTDIYRLFSCTFALGAIAVLLLKTISIRQKKSASTV